VTETQYTYIPNQRRWSGKPEGTRWSDFAIGRTETLRCLSNVGFVKVSAYICTYGHMRYTGPVGLTKKKTSSAKYRIIVRLKKQDCDGECESC
jgi:hypothetical protein